jgi:hypothetical protein
VIPGYTCCSVAASAVRAGLPLRPLDICAELQHIARYARVGGVGSDAAGEARRLASPVKCAGRQGRGRRRRAADGIIGRRRPQERRTARDIPRRRRRVPGGTRGHSSGRLSGSGTEAQDRGPT